MRLKRELVGLIGLSLMVSSPAQRDTLIVDGNLQHTGAIDAKGNRVGVWTAKVIDVEGSGAGEWTMVGEGMVRERTTYDSLGFFKREVFKYVAPSRIEQIGYGYIDRNGYDVSHGLYTVFDKDGRIESQDNYIHGMRNGLAHTYYSNGTAWQIAPYIDGKLNGEFGSFYPDGRVKERGRYEADSRVGEWKMYYDDGHMSATGNYVTGANTYTVNISKLELVLRSASGDTLEVMDYNDHVNEIEAEYGPGFPITVYHKDGLWKYFDREGVVIRTERYSQGRHLD